jgi:hypothetical protein
MTPPDEHEDPTAVAPVRRARLRKLRKVLLGLLLGLVLALCAGELLLRAVLFLPSMKSVAFAESLREAGRYADGNNEDDFWKLLCAFRGEAALHDAPNPDPLLGWTGAAIQPGSYEHVDEASIGSRRPVLLYGDSFAQCPAPAEDRFQAILARSEFGADHVLINYGVGGYGLDQIYLLLKHSLDRFEAQDPIVIVSVLVDSDMERSLLEFRGWPKPRLEISAGELLSRGSVQTNNRLYLEQHPPSIRSYLWRLFLHQQTSFLESARAAWRSDPELREEKQRLNRRILEEIERELSRRNLQHFYLAFHAEQGALKPWSLFLWQEELLAQFCAEQAVALHDTRDYLHFAADGLPENCARFYGQGRPLLGHLNGLGNLICFEAIRAGLRAEQGVPDMRHLAGLKLSGLLDRESMRTKQVPMVLMGREATLSSHSLDGQLDAAEIVAPARFLLRSETSGPTQVQFELSGEVQRFRGSLYTMAERQQGCSEGALGIEIHVDGELALELEAPPKSQARHIDIQLQGKRSFSFLVRGDRGGSGCNWVCIEDPSWE